MNRDELLLLLILFTCPITVFAQEPPSGIPDSTRSNYSDESGMGGPKSVGATLAADDQQKEFYYRLPIRVTKPWFDWKDSLNQRTGLQLGISYTTVFIGSSKVIDDAVNDKSASGGRFDFNAGWNLVNRKSGKNKGILYLRINDRHSYSSKTSPMFHGINESGYLGLPATGYRDYTIRMLELNWQQTFMEDIVHVVAGKVDPTNYFNFHGLIVPWQHFIGYGASVSGTVNWPNQGLGVVASVRPFENFYFMGAVTDVYGDRYEDGDFLDLGRTFDEDKFFKAVEIGYVPSFAERYFRKVSFMYWESDSYLAETESGDFDVDASSGWAFSSHWFFNDRYAPFIRFASSDGKGENAFYNEDIQVGMGYRLRSHDMIALSASMGKVEGVDDDQYAIELFYRFNLTPGFEITPDVQFIINPTLNPNESSLMYYGIRGRINM